MGKYGAILFCVLIGWYTFNIARVAWAGGNKTGAAVTGLLAVAAAGFPLTLLLMGGN